MSHCLFVCFSYLLLRVGIFILILGDSGQFRGGAVMSSGTTEPTE